MSLLLRLNVPDTGRITIDGRPLEEIREASLRALMTCVPQIPILLSGSIGDNLLLANPAATTAELLQALHRAALEPGAPVFPRGIDTEVGLGGDRLSPGQRQRIAMARAFLRDAAILVLDEATSALDPDSGSAIDRQILEESGRRTVVSVTHRLASVTDFDHIFVLENGRLMEDGTHQELLEKAGVYRRLWDKQQGLEIDFQDASASL
jgi:ATP-binding cassette subfamily B protein